MRIKFGLNLDAGNGPEFDENSHAVMGEVVLGSQGLLEMKNTYLCDVIGRLTC